MTLFRLAAAAVLAVVSANALAYSTTNINIVNHVDTHEVENTDASIEIKDSTGRVFYKGYIPRYGQTGTQVWWEPHSDWWVKAWANHSGWSCFRVQDPTYADIVDFEIKGTHHAFWLYVTSGGRELNRTKLDCW